MFCFMIFFASDILSLFIGLQFGLYSNRFSDRNIFEFEAQITVSKSVSKATEIFVAKYRSLIRLLKLRSDRFSNRIFFYSDAQNIGL
jgi:hypothetical protein